MDIIGFFISFYGSLNGSFYGSFLCFYFSVKNDN